jgi:GntR family transcriptional regulator
VYALAPEPVTAVGRVLALLLTWWPFPCTIFSHGTTGTLPGMQIAIDIEDPNPPFAQLIEQIKQAVSSGVLLPGSPLPSIRQLASDLDLNNKTVAKAYRLLERDSVIQSRGYRGTFVHPDGRSNSALNLNAWATEQLKDTIVTLRKAGITDPEINNAFRNVMTEQSK